MLHYVGDLHTEIRNRLLPVSKELAARDTEQIIEHVLGMSRSRIYTDIKRTVSKEEYNRICKLVQKRLTGIPLPYVLGFAYFYSKKFTVSQEVIIPRPDTEILIEIILQNEKSDICNFLDMGTGTGIIAEILAQEKQRWHAFAVDLSAAALKIAKKNCSERVLLFCNDKLSAVKKTPSFDFIVTNPPYISKAEMIDLDLCVTGFEPAIGLYGGEDGLGFYRYLARESKSFLIKNGRIYCEIGVTQSKSVTTIFKNSGWTDISIYNDLADRPRVITAKK